MRRNLPSSLCLSTHLPSAVESFFGIAVMNFFSGMILEAGGGLCVSPAVPPRLLPTALLSGDPSGAARLLLSAELLTSKRY